ncbi:hypothetical protein JAAARDRAFT_630249 [Jaapia argillacea MUCL 33604]|uniref:Uncharacterized protein n=1 Tax=Jaapia argillacea MUCL 33604 TaxID=933084 RepID=A0A067PYD2_9AGAM|nr:hypothetical protein JAAARDRAFT_630249 [Jaapia argillacea MUCL 33604]
MVGFGTRPLSPFQLELASSIAARSLPPSTSSRYRVNLKLPRNSVTIFVAYPWLGESLFRPRQMEASRLVSFDHNLDQRGKSAFAGRSFDCHMASHFDIAVALEARPTEVFWLFAHLNAQSRSFIYRYPIKKRMCLHWRIGPLFQLSD